MKDLDKEFDKFKYQKGVFKAWVTPEKVETFIHQREKKLLDQLDDLLQHGDFCEHCKANALDIADYFQKRGHWKK